MRAATALMALALAVRLLIAPGLMPIIGPEGLKVTLCTPQGVKTITLDVHGEVPTESVQDPCPYGALAATPMVPEPVHVAMAPVWHADIVAVRPALSRPHLGALAPPPPATGPPAHA